MERRKRKKSIFTSNDFLMIKQRELDKMEIKRTKDQQSISKEFIISLDKSPIVKLAYMRMCLDFSLPVPVNRWVEFIDLLVLIRQKIIDHHLQLQMEDIFQTV